MLLGDVISPPLLSAVVSALTVFIDKHPSYFINSDPLHLGLFVNYFYHPFNLLMLLCYFVETACVGKQLSEDLVRGKETVTAVPGTALGAVVE